MAILASIKETIDSGDPIIRSWPLVTSHWTPIVSTILYVFIVKRLGPALMKNRKPFDLRMLMIFYNFSIVFTYTVSLIVLVYSSLPVLLSSTSVYKFLCQPVVVKLNDFTYTCTSVGWYIYILKYAEYADTIFFVLRKKFHLVTNLHVIHHAALPIIVWIMMRTETSGFQFIPAGINSFVHIIMYTYYGLAAMGPEVQKKLWWKEYLTLLQMAQFVVILLFMFVVLPLSGCKTSVHGVYITIFFATLFLGLFINFYRKTYKASLLAKAVHSNGVHHKTNGVVNGKESNGVINGKESNGVINGKESNGVINGKEGNGIVNRKERLLLSEAFEECHF